MMNEKTRILNMLKEEKITIEEAEKLLEAISMQDVRETEIVEMKDKRGRKPKKLHVKIDGGDNSKKAKVNVSIPLSLIRTFGPVIMKNIPKETREEMNGYGIDLAQIMEDIDSVIADNSEVDIVNIDTEGEDAAKVRIYLE